MIGLSHIGSQPIGHPPVPTALHCWTLAKTLLPNNATHDSHIDADITPHMNFTYDAHKPTVCEVYHWTRYTYVHGLNDSTRSRQHNIALASKLFLGLFFETMLGELRWHAGCRKNPFSCFFPVWWMPLASLLLCVCFSSVGETRVESDRGRFGAKW